MRTVSCLYDEQLVVFFSTCDAVDFHYTIVNEFRWSPTPWKDGEGVERKLLGCEAFRLHGSMARRTGRKLTTSSAKLVQRSCCVQMLLLGDSISRMFRELCSMNLLAMLLNMYTGQ